MRSWICSFALTFGYLFIENSVYALPESAHLYIESKEQDLNYKESCDWGAPIHAQSKEARQLILHYRVVFDSESSSDITTSRKGSRCHPFSVLGTVNGALVDEKHGQPKYICANTTHRWEASHTVSLRDNGRPYLRGGNLLALHLVNLAHREIANATLLFTIHGHDDERCPPPSAEP